MISTTEHSRSTGHYLSPQKRCAGCCVALEKSALPEPRAKCCRSSLAPRLKSFAGSRQRPGKRSINYASFPRLLLPQHQQPAQKRHRTLDGWLGHDWVVGGAPVSAAERVAREWAPGWDVNAVTGDQGAIEELAQLIGNAEGQAASVFRAVFPALFEAFVVQPDSASQVLKPLYAMLLTVLALGEGNSPDDLELARQLAEALLECGNNRTEYRAMVQDLEELLVGSPSINTLSWALDAAEVLAINPAPDFWRAASIFYEGA